MTSLSNAGIAFHLTAPAFGVAVSVTLRTVGERWVAVAATAGREETGIGPTAREALLASLGGLPEPVRLALLVDLALLEPSLAVARAAGG